jgi:hypothetical protein
MYEFSAVLEDLLREGFEIKLNFHKGRAILQRAELFISHPRIGEIRLTGDTPINALDRMILIGHQKNTITLRPGCDQGLDGLLEYASSPRRNDSVSLELFADDGLVFVEFQRNDNPAYQGSGDTLPGAVEDIENSIKHSFASYGY